MADLEGALLMDSTTLLDLGAGASVHRVLAMFFLFPALAAAELIRWNPGKILLKGFAMYASGGVDYCISLNGTVAADPSPPTQTPGVIWKGATQFGLILFPNDGMAIEQDDTVYISKNQANACPHTIFYVGDVDSGT